MSRLAVLPLGLSLVAAGCGSSGVAAPDVAAYLQLDSKVQTALSTHCANAAAMTDASSCPAERDRYAAEMQPMLSTMSADSGAMDACMDAMGHTGSADMYATCQSMLSELSSHLQAYCSSGDLATEKAEAQRHCSAMQTMTAHEADVAGSMMGGMGGGMMSGGAMMSGGTCHT